VFDRCRFCICNAAGPPDHQIVLHSEYLYCILVWYFLLLVNSPMNLTMSAMFLYTVRLWLLCKISLWTWFYIWYLVYESPSLHCHVWVGGDHKFLNPVTWTILLRWDTLSIGCGDCIANFTIRKHGKKKGFIKALSDMPISTSDSRRSLEKRTQTVFFFSFSNEQRYSIPMRWQLFFAISFNSMTHNVDFLQMNASFS